MFNIIYRILVLSQDSLMHFWLAFSLGVLVYSVTSITFIVLFAIMEKRGRIISSKVAGIGIVLIPLLLSLSLALLSHYGLDYWYTWFNAPLGPPLTIN